MLKQATTRDSVNQELLQRFIKEEADSHVRQLLLRHISDWRGGTAHGRRTYEFNRYNVTIDCASNIAIVEDELDVASAGEASWPLEEFAAAIRRGISN